MPAGVASGLSGERGIIKSSDGFPAPSSAGRPAGLDPVATSTASIRPSEAAGRVRTAFPEGAARQDAHTSS